MALFPQKNGVTVCALAPREGLIGGVVSALGSDWTEARLSLFFTGISAVDENGAGPSGGETLSVADVSDYLTIGLKDESNRYLPGEAGSSFLGVRSTGTTSEATVSEFADSNGECSAVGYAGATLIDGGVVTNGSMEYPDPEPAEAYNGFYSVKFVVSNRGTSSQSVAISCAKTAIISGNDYGKARLLNLTQNATFGAAKVVAWNTGAAARGLPTQAWVRIPFYNFRLRVQALMALKVAP